MRYFGSFMIPLLALWLMTQQEGEITTLQSASPRIQTTSRLVIVPTIVRDHYGAYVPGLSSSDFELTDDNVLRPVHVEPAKCSDVALVIVMQTGAVSSRDFSQYRAITKNLDDPSVRVIRKLALITFDSSIRQVWSFPDNSDGVRYALEHLDAGDNRAAMMDAVSHAMQLLQQQPPRLRRVVLLLSQAQDNGSKIQFSEMLRLIGQSNASVYSVIFPSERQKIGRQHSNFCSTSASNRLHNGESTSGNSLYVSQLDDLLCKETASQMAILSGGEHIEVRNKTDFARASSIISDSLINGYMLSFQSSQVVPGFHFIKVRARYRPESLLMASRTIYWLP